MFSKQAGKSAEMPPLPTRMHLEHEDCEIVREVYETMQNSNLNKFTALFIDSLCNDLSIVLHELDHLPEAPFNELTEVIYRLPDARSELRLARFLFDIEEINHVYRFIMRNRAILRGKHVLHKVLQVWPLNSSSGKP